MEQKQQELIYKLSIFEQQIRQIQEQIQAVEKAIVEISSLSIELDEINGKEGKEILASIGKGIFAKAKLVSDELIVGIGAGNFIKKSIPETKKIIERQIEKLEEAKKELNSNLEMMGREIEEMMKEAEGKK